MALGDHLVRCVNNARHIPPTRGELRKPTIAIQRELNHKTKAPQTTATAWQSAILQTNAKKFFHA
jgi:hypothetical protein